MDFLMRRPGLPPELKFASLQSGLAPKIPGLNAAGADADTIVLQRNRPDGGSRVYLMSDAILRVLMSLGGAWVLMGVFFAVPRVLRNALYLWIARNRYRWFGRRDSCRLPTASEKARFLS